MDEDKIFVESIQDGAVFSDSVTDGILTASLSFTAGDDVPFWVYINSYAGAAVIPEPATVALLGIGLAGLGGRYLKRRRSRQKK